MNTLTMIMITFNLARTKPLFSPFSTSRGIFFPFGYTCTWDARCWSGVETYAATDAGLVETLEATDDGLVE